MSFDGLRVALIGPMPPPAGGMAMQTRQLAELLEQEGATVALVPVNPPYQPAWTARVRGLRAVIRLFQYVVRLWRSLRGAHIAHVMANSGWSWHLFAAPAVWIARLRGVPVLVNYRGGEAPAFLARSMAWVRPTLSAASLVAVPSRFLQEVFASHGLKTEVLPNVVDLGRFQRSARAPTHSPRLVVARNLEPMYDIPTALRAFARVRQAVPDARLGIAGTGPELSRLQSIAKELEVADAVTFQGRLDRDGMADLYRQSDIMLNPTRVDNMPNSVLEAMACGLPIVSTRVGGVPYIVEDGVTALLVEPGDDVAMAHAALQLINDGGMASRIAAAAHVEVQQYTWERVQVRLAEMYGRIVLVHARGMRIAS